MRIRKFRLQIFLTLVFLGFVGWWISFQHIVASPTEQNSPYSAVGWFENVYWVVAFIGAIIGLAAVKKWGGIKTILGKSLLFFALGLLTQSAGQLIYSYYTVADKIQTPYPSLGDVAYFGSVLVLSLSQKTLYASE